jgi:hypothetical protein
LRSRAPRSGPGSRPRDWCNEERFSKQPGRLRQRPHGGTGPADSLPPDRGRGSPAQDAITRLGLSARAYHRVSQRLPDGADLAGVNPNRAWPMSARRSSTAASIAAASELGGVKKQEAPWSY